MESSGQASSWVMGSSAANDNFNHLVTTRTWSQVLLLLSFLFLGKKNPRHTQNMFGLLLGTLDYLQMAGSKDPINLQQPQLHLISRIIGLNKEIKWKPRKTTEKNEMSSSGYIFSGFIELQNFNFKHIASSSFFYFSSLSLRLGTNFPSFGLDILSVSSFMGFEYVNTNHWVRVWSTFLFECLYSLRFWVSSSSLKR